jgi:hypothetical protein
MNLGPRERDPPYVPSGLGYGRLSLETPGASNASSLDEGD